MTRTALVLAAFVSLALLGQAGAAESPKIVQPEAFTWQPAQGLPPGAEMTVLYGDPSKAGPFALRLEHFCQHHDGRRLAGAAEREISDTQDGQPRAGASPEHAPRGDGAIGRG